MVETAEPGWPGPGLTSADILVVGAGPVGSALALHAHLGGARVLLLERRRELPRPSRAMLLWPRTLASLARLGILAELAEHPSARLTAHLHIGARAVPLALSDFRVGSSGQQPLMVRQAMVEAVLQRALDRSGVPRMTGTELSGLERAGGRVLAMARRTTGAGGDLHLSCRYLVGCDGAASTVRNLSGIPWQGRTYPEEAVLADVEWAADPGKAHIGVGRLGIGFLFPGGEHGAGWRLVATRTASAGPGTPGQDGPPLSLAEIRSVLRGANLPDGIGSAAWSTSIRLQRRRAGRYRAGPVFLAGDAAHVFSPAGAQGMNTGLQDAENLGWKLAAVCNGSAGPDRLLSSYNAERRPVARGVGLVSGILLHGEGDARLPFRLARTRVLPLMAPLLPPLIRAPALMAPAAALLSQDWVSYRASPLNGPGRLRPGRLAAGRPLPNLRTVSGGRSVRLPELVERRGIHVFHGPGVQFPDHGPAGIHGHRMDRWPAKRIVAVRPDGYIGIRDESGSVADLWEWLRLVSGNLGGAL
ncbi:FAD-dependent monooxygenase [Arthrobacter gandavensis]|uniref:FAD-dependent monooxygenase n=1 Tax=Arthrobacter gandavensis TaxID=169960 RepID=UPI00188FC358|nr:FAD-dependent monooxygenase [Arthrobacter gandavensis]MBF4992689.1 FAD-dependent monooxygenase [Arthrobacter gandavensis]